MKKKDTDVRKRLVVVRLSEPEYRQLQQLRQKTIEKTISGYLRRVALARPVVVKYRNASADDFLRDMVALRRELSALGNNYSQAVKKLHLLERIPEFRSWLLIYEQGRQAFQKQVEQIHERITTLYELWSQK